MKNLLGAALLLCSGCVNPFDGKDCTLIGCVSTLTVTVAGSALTDVRIEVFSSSTATPDHVIDCSKLDCTAGVRLEGYTPAALSVRVYRSNLLARAQSYSPKYDAEKPNGPDCEPTCYSGGILVQA